MARVEVVMPKMGESVMEGTVLEWKKAVGDTIEQDETLLEISTDKVDSEVPSPEAGRIAEILVEENDTVEVGTPIAVIETDVNAEVGGGSDGAPPQADEGPVETAAEPLNEVEPVGDDPQPEPEAKPAAPTIRPAGDGGEAGGDEAGGDGAAGGGARTEVVMPKMGESVMEGTVLEWKKAIGDEVEQDETLLEISTDKVDSEVPSPEAGTLLEILVEEGETVEVGTPIAVIGSGEAAPAGAPAPSPGTSASGDGAQGGAPAPYEKSYSAESPTADAAPAVQEARGAEAAAAATAGDGGPIPRRDDAGNFYSPLVRSIAEAEGISLAELQQIEGTGSEGRVSKADVMAFLDQRGEAPAQPAETPEPKSYSAQSLAPETSAAQPVAPSRPAARQSAPAGGAPRTRAEAAEASASAAGDRVETIQMDRMRQLIAEHMRRSKDTSAHVTSFAEIDVTGLVKHREAHKAAFQAREGTKLTFTPYFIEGAIEPLRDHPLLNSSVDGTQILVKKDYHIGIAVAVGKKGLLVPVVRNAGQQNLTGLAHTVADLAERARSKKLQPDELQGGTFTITNVGSLGSLMGTPIINQPQSAILSPGAITKRPVVVEVDGEDVIAIRHMMYVSLSYDHRIIDGAMAASFLAAYRRQLEAIGPDSALL